MKDFLSIKATHLVYPVLIMLIIGVFVGEYFSYDKHFLSAEEGQGESQAIEVVELDASFPAFSGHAQEGEPKTLDIGLAANVTWLSFTLAWSDEPDETLMTNQPDTFELVVELASGEVLQSGAVSNSVGAAYSKE